MFLGIVSHTCYIYTKYGYRDDHREEISIPPITPFAYLHANLCIQAPDTLPNWEVQSTQVNTLQPVHVCESPIHFIVYALYERH